MKNIIILALSLINGIILNSCTSVDMFLHPSEYEKKTIKIEPVITKEYLYDTVYIKNDGGEVISGVRPSRQLKFSKIGQIYKFQNGESIEVILDSIDMNTMTLDMVTDEATKEITLKLIHKDSARVFISERCQTVNRYNTNFIPKVELAKGVPMEQVVSTPICDDECNVIGYQIRYGAIQGGCRDMETTQIFRRFKDCQKDGKVSNAKSSSKLTDRERLLRKLGFK